MSPGQPLVSSVLVVIAIAGMLLPAGHAPRRQSPRRPASEAVDAARPDDDCASQFSTAGDAMNTESAHLYPIGFDALMRHLRDTDLPVATHGVDLCATAVLFAIDTLHPRTMAALADAIVARSDGEALSPALCEVAASNDPDRDPDIRASFGAFLRARGLILSADEGWTVLARVGGRHARDLAEQMVSGALDPIEGAIEIDRCFEQYLPVEERRRICCANELPPLERTRSLAPFVGFTQVGEDLYQAGLNLNEWNDRLPHAPFNRLSATEKETALARLRGRYLALAAEARQHTTGPAQS